MKKVVSFVLSLMILVALNCMPVGAATYNDGDVLQFSGPTKTNALGDIVNWNGFVLGNLKSIIDIEGTVAVAGSFTSERGFSANHGSYGSEPANTDNVALLIGGNVNVKGYGSVRGQTAVGNALGNTYRLSNVTASGGTTNGKYITVNSTQYFKDAKQAAYNANSAIAKLPANGVCNDNGYGLYTFAGDKSAKTLVYDLSVNKFSSFILDFNVADGQTVFVNLTSESAINFTNGSFRINGNNASDFMRNNSNSIVFNVVKAPEVKMTSCELYGTFIAPHTNLTGDNANICGTTVVNDLTGIGGFELHMGKRSTPAPEISLPTDPEPTDSEPTNPDPIVTGETVEIRVDTAKKMAVKFADGTVYYGGEKKTVKVGEEYYFQMCSVNWENGIYDENGNGLCGTVVYKMKVVHAKEFNELRKEAVKDPTRYTVKGIDIIDNDSKTIIVNCDAKDFHLETDVNNFFIAYRFHFKNGDYNKQTGIENVVNKPLESLSVNLPLGTTITCDAYKAYQSIDTDNVFITRNNGEGNYADEYLTSVNDYYWNH